MFLCSFVSLPCRVLDDYAIFIILPLLRIGAGDVAMAEPEAAAGRSSGVVENPRPKAMLTLAGHEGEVRLRQFLITLDTS